MAASLAQPVTGQIASEVRVFADDTTGGGDAYLRFDRTLTLLSATHVSYLGGVLAKKTPIGVDSAGRSWIAFDPLNTTQLLRLDNQGNVLPSTWLADTPVNVVVGADGRAYATTRIGLSASGPAYGVDSAGKVLWSNISGPAQFTFGYPQQLVMTSTGQVWIAYGKKPHGPTPWTVPYLMRLDPSNGNPIQSLALPGLAGFNIGVVHLSAAPAGTMWAFVDEGLVKRLYEVDGTRIAHAFEIDGGANSATEQMYIDCQGRPHVVSLFQSGASGSKLLRYDPGAPSAPDAVYQFGGTIVGWEFGPSGEDVYAVIAPTSAPLTRRLERMNLVTLTKSSVSLDPKWFDSTIAYGDATGWVFASVIDRGGDNDGDGVSNGAETDAGSDPFDVKSTPDGPKVYVSFQPVTNAITLTWKDSDGLFDPVGGLDLSSISLKASGYGEVMSYLWPFLSAVTLSPDGKEATLVLGGLPLPPNLKIALEPHVKDKTGHESWDSQVTPPGDL